ncbi:hypothetical protein BDZ85DRAFT_191 [Elsinoe ampelina]|uniref:Major facilitator superfamily domain-containing protein n=1 Tax=Elsinoe ampelina TaxID=302913 RepID=A0A6A6GNX9_9PEZI|nr:hypothetical protein BDZ85DRAFT_191 [Elsinoe ampelina]
MPSLVQNALLLESLGNILGGLSFLLTPRLTLSLLVRDPSALNPLSLTLWQMLGGITLALTVPLLAAYSDTPTGEAQRRSAYVTLGMGEGVIVPLLLAGWVKGSSPFGEGMVFGGSAVLAGAAAWRVWCLVVRPEVMAVDGGRKGQ